MPPDDDLKGRVERLERDFDDFREWRREVKDDIRELRRDLAGTKVEISSLKETLSKDLQDVRDRLASVVSGALNSLPPWAATALILAGLLVGGLGVYVAVK